jgi:hypothetical protein
MIYIVHLLNVLDVTWIKKCRRLSSPTRRGIEIGTVVLIFLMCAHNCQ